MSAKSIVRLALAAAAILAPTVASAHPLGPPHGFMHGFTHPFGGIDHVLAMVAVGMLAVHFGGRALWALPLTFMTVMAAGAMLGAAGMAVPYVEAAIALSVIVLGIAIVVERPWPLAAAVALVGVFAVFHGHAHGTEMAATASAAAYGLGFLLATGLLHATGIGLGAGFAKSGAARAHTLGRVGGAAIAAAGIGLFAWVI